MKTVIKMKTIYYILIALVIVGFNSCDEMLDLKPISDQTTGNFYQNQDHMEQAVAAMYNGLRPYYTQQRSRMTRAPSDNVEIGGLGYDEGGGGITKYITTTSNFVVLDTWQDAFAALYRANVVLDKAESAEYEDEAVKARHIAEARFVRGVLYLDMVRFYKGVPIMEEPLPLEEYYGIKRATEDETWDFALANLDYAVDNLPTEVDGSGRANKWAALAHRAELKMDRNLDYAGALADIDQIIGSRNYELLPEFADVWDDANNNGLHSIWAIQFLAQTGEGNPMPTQVVPKFIWEEMWLYAGQGGEHGTTVSEELYDTYDSTDLRRDLTVWDWWIDGRDMDTIYEFWPVKHGISNTPFAYQTWGINHLVTRYADILLMKAECENELGNTAAALPLINQIRSRAGLADFASDDKQATREEIFLQRRLELAFEEERWFDLLRWDKLEPGKMTEILDAFVDYIWIKNGSQGDPPVWKWDERYKLYPIPILEIAKVGADILEQNPGY